MFRQSLSYRLYYINEYLKKTTNQNFEQKSVKIQFNENIPKNLVEIADIISKLHGVIPNDYLYAEYPNIEDVDHAKKLMQKQQSEGVQAVEYNNFTNTGDNEE